MKKVLFCVLLLGIGVSIANTSAVSLTVEEQFNQLADQWQSDISNKKTERIWGLCSAALLALGGAGFYGGCRLSAGNLLQHGKERSIPFDQLFFRAEFGCLLPGLFYKKVDNARVPWYNPHQMCTKENSPGERDDCFVSEQDHGVMSVNRFRRLDKVPSNEVMLVEAVEKGDYRIWPVGLEKGAYKQNFPGYTDAGRYDLDDYLYNQHYSLAKTKETRTCVVAGIANLVAGSFAAWKSFNAYRERIKKEAFYITRAKNLLMQSNEHQLLENQLTPTAKKLLALAKSAPENWTHVGSSAQYHVPTKTSVFGWAATSVGLLGLGAIALHCSKRFADGAVELANRSRLRHDHVFFPLKPEAQLIGLNAVGVLTAGIYAGWKCLTSWRQRTKNEKAAELSGV